MSAASRSELRDQAIEWVARMDRGEWSAESENALQAWLAADPRRQGILLQVQATWTALERPTPGPSIVTGSVDQTAEASEVDGHWLTRRRALVGGGAALAASLIGGVALRGRATVLKTGIGEIRRVPLADGSIAAINTQSEIDVAFADDRRDLKLTKGEAWFQVAHNPRRPFTVQAGSVHVRAVGTAFSVRRRERGAEIIVTEGTVDIWSEGTTGVRSRLKAGQAAYLDGLTLTEREADAASADHTLAWRSGRIELVNERLQDAIAEFNRYNQRQLVLADERLSERRLDGYFRTDDLEAFARAVEGALNVPIDMAQPMQIRIGSSSGRTSI